MSFGYGWRGPNIVKDGLVLYLDPGSPNSYYNKTGTTIKDISGNGLNGSLTNFGSQTIYNSANGGSIVFDGIDDFINLTNIGFSLMGSGISSTVSLWTKVTNLSPGRNMVFFEQSTNSSNRYVIWFQDSDDTLNFYPNALNHKSSTININTWYFICTTVNGTSSKMYLNGNQIGSSVNYSPSNTNTNTYLGVSPIYTNEFLYGGISNLQIYNRDLSASEVLQNYNALKGRFGL